MQDWSDNPVDEVVVYGLQSVSVTQQQKRAAWETLRARAEQQPILPPLAAHVVAIRPPRRRSTPFALPISVMQWIVSLMMDDTRYDRALNQRHRQCLMLFFDNRAAIWSAA